MFHLVCREPTHNSRHNAVYLMASRGDCKKASSLQIRSLTKKSRARWSSQKTFSSTRRLVQMERRWAGWASVNLSKGSEHKDTFCRSSEIQLGIPKTRRLLALIVAHITCQTNSVAYGSVTCESLPIQRRQPRSPTKCFKVLTRAIGLHTPYRQYAPISISEQQNGGMAAFGLAGARQHIA